MWGGGALRGTLRRRLGLQGEAPSLCACCAYPIKKIACTFWRFATAAVWRVVHSCAVEHVTQRPGVTAAAPGSPTLPAQPGLKDSGHRNRAPRRLQKCDPGIASVCGARLRLFAHAARIPSKRPLAHFVASRPSRSDVFQLFARRWASRAFSACVSVVCSPWNGLGMDRAYRPRA